MRVRQGSERGSGALGVFADVLDHQVRVQGDVFGVGFFLRVLAQGEGAARHDAAHMAHAHGAVAALAQGLHAQSGQVLALALGLVGGFVGTLVGLAVVRAAHPACGVSHPADFVATPQVHLLARMAGVARGRCVCCQCGAGAGVVVFTRGVAAAGQAVYGAEAVDVFPVYLVAQRVEGDLVVSTDSLALVTLCHLKRAVVVAPDQAVHTVAVRKMEVDSPLLHQAGDEFKVGLVVLDAVVALGVGFYQAFVTGKGVVCKDCFDDFYRGLVLEYFAVGG